MMCARCETLDVSFVSCFSSTTSRFMSNVSCPVDEGEVGRDLLSGCLCRDFFDKTPRIVDMAVEPMFAKKRLLKKQNATLAVARDMLLPRLMKGGLEVP